MAGRELYRQYYGTDLETQTLTLGETDLALCLPPGVWTPRVRQALHDYLLELRRDLQAYLRHDPDFAATHTPYRPAADAPSLAQAMAQAAARAGVGPMAAVAGAFAQAAGQWLTRLSPEVLVENGGDSYLAGTRQRLVGVYAGEDNPFTGKLGLRIKAEQQPLGVCASSGTMGHSFSYGKADVAVILAGDTLLADAMATATCNRVQTAGDLQAALDFAAGIPGVTGALIVVGEHLAAWGTVELADLS